MQLLLQCMDACCAPAATGHGPAQPPSAPPAPCCSSSASTPSGHHAPPSAQMAGDLGLAAMSNSYPCASQACGFDLGWDAVPCADPGCSSAPCTEAGCVASAPPPHSDGSGLASSSSFVSPASVPGSSVGPSAAPVAPPAAPPAATPVQAQADHSASFPFNMPLNEMLLHICCSDHNDQSVGLPLTLSSTGANDWLALASSLTHGAHAPQSLHHHPQDMSHSSASTSDPVPVQPQVAHGQAAPGPLDLLRSASAASAPPSQVCNDFSFPSSVPCPSNGEAHQSGTSVNASGNGEQLLLDPVLFDPSTVCTSPSCLDPAWLFFDAPHGSCTMDQPHVHQAEPDLDDTADDDEGDDIDGEVDVNDPEASIAAGALEGAHPSSTGGPTPSAPSGGVFECQWGACRAQYRSAHRLIEHVQRKHLDLLLPQAVVDKTTAAALLARRGRRRKAPAPHVHPRPHAHFHPPHGDVLHPHLVLHNAPPHIHQAPVPRPAACSQSPGAQHAHGPTEHKLSDEGQSRSHTHPHSHPHSHVHDAHSHARVPDYVHPHLKSEQEMPPPALANTEGQITPPHPGKRESVPPLESSGASPGSSRPPTPGSERSPAAIRPLAGEAGDVPEKHACCWGTCQAQFDSLDELNSHLSQEHVGSGKSSYRCEWRGCSRAAQGEEGAFKQRQKLQRHLQTHTNFRPFVCTVCNAAFGEATGLSLHMRTHSGQRPFACDWPGCDKRFATSGSLVNHLRVHRGDRPFACPICGRAFAEASNLSKHKKTHTGEKRYACRICNKFYARSDQLARHMRGHEMKSDDGESAGMKRSPTPLDRTGSPKRAHAEA